METTKRANREERLKHTAVQLRLRYSLAAVHLGTQDPRGLVKVHGCVVGVLCVS